MTANEELELKYAIDDPAVARRWLDLEFPLLESQAADDGRWTSHTITDRYFDTADGALTASGHGARLRRTGGRTTLTLKSDIEVAGALHRREELEGPATKALDPSAWPESIARRRLLELVGDKRLIERFSVRVRRRERLLTAGRAVIAASIDEGRVEAAGVDAGPIRQLEFELKGGARTGMDVVARAAEASGIVRGEPRSKLVIAAEMSAEAARVQLDDQFAEAGRKVLRRHLLRMLERETATRSSDELGLKQMRVATRRMRATWRVFADAYRKGTRRRFTDDLRRIGQALGTVRDLDVQIAAAGKERGLAALVNHWHAVRLSAVCDLQLLLESEDYARFIDDALEFTSTPGDGSTRRGRTRVRRAGAAALEAAFERVIAAGLAAVDQDDPVAWHSLRIEGRRFRYSLEAFAEISAPEPTSELHGRTIRLQDHLGEVNDAQVTIAEVTAWLESGDGSGLDRTTRNAAAKYVASRHARIAQLRNGFTPIWAEISGPAARELLAAALQPLTRS